MAITGTGTQNDPYLVHSYDELKTVTTDNSYCPQYEHRYISLDADIDCNVYGSNFEWETIALGHDSRGFTLDLNGHTIKNISVKVNNSVFDASYAGSNVYGAWYSEFVGNGKILNVFTQPSSTAYVIKGRGTSNVISDLSMSVSLGNLSAGAFYNSNVENSSIYLEQPQTSNSGAVLVYSDNNVGGDDRCGMENCDILLNISNQKACLINGYHASTYAVGFDNCRIRGKNGSTGLPQYYICSNIITNSVIDLDSTEASWTSGISPLSRYPMRTGSSGVINWDKRASDQPSDNPGLYTCGMAAVSSSEIVNGDALRNAGFTVVNVVG